ncbi:MAG: hypothetical protein IJN85_00530, partial [Oscillospiraceae bacterium]|nr:hypothetical protein [Oscillospiraceae bacterium]
HIDGDEFEDLYGCLYMKYGTQHRGSFDYKTWYPYEKNFYIYLSTHEENGNTVTQCGFYPVE